MTSPAARPPQPPYERVSYPPAPWTMVGSLWLSLFRVRDDVDEQRPAGVYGAAFVDYAPGSPLTYSELLVARALPGGGNKGRAVSITDIWVDSAASVAGGRELWAIPKGRCDFDCQHRSSGPLSHTTWSASIAGHRVARASFADPCGLAPRTPFRGRTWQPGLPESGGERTAVLRGSARTLPARAWWEFAADGPLAYLASAQQLASVRLASFRMRFG